jgi:hypothetical protein
LAVIRASSEPGLAGLWRDNQDESGASIKMRQGGRVRR